MSDPVKTPINIGAYKSPHSGIGVEYAPMGSVADYPTPILHEVGYLPENQTWNFPRVLSPFWRILYNFSPGHQIQLEGVVYELEPGHILMIPSHRLLHCMSHGTVSTFWVHFSMPYNVAPKQPIPILLKPEPEELEIIRRITGMIEGERRSEPAKKVFHPAMALLHLLLERAGIAWQIKLPPILSHVLEFIESHLNEKLSNACLAKEACMSIETLGRLFRKQLHVSPAQYVNQIRIRQAGQMLEQSEMPIDKIAEATGFPNRAYFSRVFKQTTAVSPAAYRVQFLAHRKQFKKPPPHHNEHHGLVTKENKGIYNATIRISN